MVVALRLYRRYDLDLMALYFDDSFNFPSAVKSALKAHIENKNIKIQTPWHLHIGEDVPAIVKVCLTLNDETDGDIIDWIKNTKHLQRNSEIKNLLRYYMSRPCILPFRLNNEQEQEPTEEIISASKKTVKRKVAAPIEKKVIPKKSEKNTPKRSNSQMQDALRDIAEKMPISHEPAHVQDFEELNEADDNDSVELDISIFDKMSSQMS